MIIRDMAAAKRSSRLTAVISLALAAGLLGCPQRYSISVEPGSTQDRLAFRFSSGWSGRGGAAVPRIEVRRCEADSNDPAAVLWAVAYPGRGHVRTVRYGEPPKGFSPVVTARPLSSGCYVIKAEGGEPQAEFQITEDGAIRVAAG